MNSVFAAGRDGRRWMRPGALIVASAMGLAALWGCDGGTPASAVAVAAEPQSGEAGPVAPEQLSKVVKADPARVDLGDIPAKVVTEQEVKLHNTGTKPLVFTRATTSCGCTSAEVEKREIQPGDFAVLTVKWTASDHNAPKSTKTVYVFADGYGAPVQIPVTAAVVGGIDPSAMTPQITSAPAVVPMSVKIEPSELDFGFIKPETVAKGSLTIENTGELPLELARVTSNCSCAVGKLAKSTLEPGESTTVDVEMTAGPNIGVLHREVQVWGKDHPQPLRVTVKANVSYDVNADPMFINMLGARTGEIRLTSVDGRAFRVLSANNHEPELVGGSGGAATEHTLRWDLTNTPDSELPRFFVVATDHPGMPLLDLRVIHTSLFPQSSKPDPWTPTLDRLVLGRIDASTEWTREVQLVKLGKDATVKLESPDGMFKGEVLEQRMEQRGLMVKVRVTPVMEKISGMNGHMPVILQGALVLSTDDPEHSVTLPVYATMSGGGAR